MGQQIAIWRQLRHPNEEVAKQMADTAAKARLKNDYILLNTILAEIHLQSAKGSTHYIHRADYFSDYVTSQLSLMGFVWRTHRETSEGLMDVGSNQPHNVMEIDWLRDQDLGRRGSTDQLTAPERVRRASLDQTRDTNPEGRNSPAPSTDE